MTTTESLLRLPRKPLELAAYHQFANEAKRQLEAELFDIDALIELADDFNLLAAESDWPRMQTLCKRWARILLMGTSFAPSVFSQTLASRF